MKANSIEDAKKNSKILLEKYKENQNYSDLESAFNLDNTNPTIIFEYLYYWKQNNAKKFQDELKKYKFFLDKDSCDKLEIKYINHQEDIINIINSFQNIDNDNLDMTSIKENSNNILHKYYPKEDKEIFAQKNEKRINNLPLDNLENDIIFYLTIKVILGAHLHLLSDFKINEEDDLKKQSNISHFQNAFYYLKLFSEILKYYISKNERILVFKLTSILNLGDYYNVYAESLSRLNFFLNDMKLDNNIIQKLAGNLYSDLNLCSVNNNDIIKRQIFLEEYKELFFEFLENILKSNCIKQLINQLMEKNKDKNSFIFSDNNYINYINYIINNILFLQFFNENNFGLTITLNGKIIINDEYRSIKAPFEQTNLYNFSTWIITGILEIIGHFLKNYLFYITKFVISEESGSSDENKSGNIENGDLVEELLFNKVEQFYLGDILYILDINNWNKNLNEFASYFNSVERKKIINEGLKKEDLLNYNKELIELLSKFHIEKFDLLMFKTNTHISLKRIDSPPFIDLSERKCVTAIKRKKKGKFH